MRGVFWDSGYKTLQDGSFRIKLAEQFGEIKKQFGEAARLVEESKAQASAHEDTILRE